MVDAELTCLSVAGGTRCREAGAEAMVDVEADAQVAADSGAHDDSETAVDEAEFFEFFKDLEDRREIVGVMGCECGERGECRRWGVRETWRPMAICSMVGRAVEGVGRGKRLRDWRGRSPEGLSTCASSGTLSGHEVVRRG